MRAADSGSIGQGQNGVETGGHHRGVALEQLAAAAAKDGVATKQAAMADIAEMVERVAGRGQHVEMQIRFGEIHRIAAAKGMGDGGNAWVVGAVDGTVVALTQEGVAASMVAVMVGDEYSRKHQPMRVEIRDQRRGIARVDRPEAAAPLFRRYRTSEGLTTDSTRCVTEDRDGRIYYSAGLAPPH